MSFLDAETLGKGMLISRRRRSRMTVENHHHRKTSTGMSRRDLLRAGLWGTVGWAGWSVGTGSRTLAINPAPAHAGEQPRAGGTLAMWTQGDPPNFDLHQNSAF